MANERLIDANEVIKETESILNFRRQHHMPTAEYEALLGYLKNRPTVEAVEVVHGHWVHDGQRIHNGVDWWHCSECNKTATGVEIEFNYCPNCGAKMDGDGNG